MGTKFDSGIYHFRPIIHSPLRNNLFHLCYYRITNITLFDNNCPTHNNGLKNLKGQCFPHKKRL